MTNSQTSGLLCSGPISRGQSREYGTDNCCILESQFREKHAFACLPADQWRKELTQLGCSNVGLFLADRARISNGIALLIHFTFGKTTALGVYYWEVFLGRSQHGVDIVRRSGCAGTVLEWLALVLILIHMPFPVKAVPPASIFVTDQD